MNPLISCDQMGTPEAVSVPAFEGFPIHRNEELLNAATHAAGAVMGVIGSLVLLERAADCGIVYLIACATYAATLVTLYLASTLYHLAQDRSLKRMLRTVDHVCIFLLIAGTYTPVMLISLRGSAWAPLIVIWSVAACGTALKVAAADRTSGTGSTLLYAATGLLGIPIMPQMIQAFSQPGAVCIVAGGAAYLAGLIFFVQERPWFHALWHVFVLAGSICHYSAILSALPAIP